MRGGGNDAGGPPRQRVKLPPSGWGAPDPAAVSGLGTAPRRCPAGLDQSLRRAGASPLRQLRRGLARLLRTIWFWVPCPKVSDLGKFLSSVIYRGGGSHSNRRVTAWPPATPHARRCRSRPRRRLPGRVRRCGAVPAGPPTTNRAGADGRREGGPGCGPAGAGGRGWPGRQRAALSPGDTGTACAGHCHCCCSCCRCPVPARARSGTAERGSARGWQRPRGWARSALGLVSP